MLYAQEAMIAFNNGQSAESMALYEQAFALERDVAMSFVDKEGSEPTRSVLFRSAGSLAKTIGRYREAEQLIAHGLAGNPPDEIAEELRNLYEDVNFHRHLSLKGEQLGTAEFRLSIDGDGVGYGLAPADEINKRMAVIEQLAVRSAERIRGNEYRASGQAPKEIRDQFRFYQAVPKAASFAITIRLGQPSVQTVLPFFDDEQAKVIDAIFGGIQLINEGQEDKLVELIQNKNYRQNFISLIKALAPDGDVIRQVGFTISRKGEPQSVALTKRRAELVVLNTPTRPNSNTVPVKSQLVGILKFADGIKNYVQIVPESGIPQKITVPSGLSDIVKIYWEDEVKVTLTRKGSKFVLEDIEKIY